MAIGALQHVHAVNHLYSYVFAVTLTIELNGFAHNVVLFFMWSIYACLFVESNLSFFPYCFLQVTITPEVPSRTVNRAIIAELVRLYKESDLGMRLPAYDGRKSLYTAGELPFAWKEFTIKLIDEEDGINGPK